MSSERSTSDGERQQQLQEPQQQQLQRQQQQQRDLEASCQEEPQFDLQQLSQSIGEELRPRLQRRNQFIFARKTALSMDQCPMVWSQQLGPSPAAIHSHSGSDTGLLLASVSASTKSGRIAQSMESVQKRRSVTDSPHLRVLHDSLTSLTSRITGGGSQEYLPEQQQQQQRLGSSETGSPTSAVSSSSSAHHQPGKSSRSRRKLKDSRDKLADSLRVCETGGLPRPENQAQLESLCLELEPSWEVTDLSGAAADKAVKQQAAIWELLQTEANILRHLKTLIEVYVTVIKHLQSSCGLLTDVSTELLFPGISEVFQAHFTLWTEHLRPALAAARRSRARVRPGDFYRGFAEFRAVFQPSAEYCMRIAEAKDYLKSLEKNESFNDFVRVGHVTSFCNQLNATYRSKCDQADLRGVAERIEEAKLHEWMESLGDDTASVLESHRLNLMRPMPHNGQPRRKLVEGDLRCKDEKGKWSDAKCLLFTDMLMLAKSSKRNCLRLLRPPLRLDRLIVHKLSENYAFLLIALTDFGSVDTVLCLAGDSQKAADDWAERVSQAKTALVAQMLRPAQSAYADGSDAQQHQQEQPVRLRQPARAMQDATAGGLHHTHSSCDMDSLQHQARLHQGRSLHTELALSLQGDSTGATATAAAPDCNGGETWSGGVGLPQHLQELAECNRRSSHV